MFKFIRGLFAKDTVETISVSNMDEWFHQKTLELEQNFSKRLSELRNDLSERIKKTHELMKVLEAATLQNPNISVRERQFMEGNRKSYVQRTTHFLKELEEMRDEKLSFFLHHYQEYVNNFTKSTNRSYQIIGEFFSNEIRNIAITIKDIDAVVERMKSDKDIRNYNKIKKLRKELEETDALEKKRKDLAKEIESLKEKIKGLRDKEKKCKEEKESFLASKEFASFLSLKEKREEVKKEIKKLSDTLYAHFSSLDRPFKKYQRMAFKHDKLIAQYAGDPLKAVVSDFDLHILEILNGVKENIGKLGIKNENKVLNNIAALDQKFFTSFHKNYNDLLQKRNQIDEKIKNDPSPEKSDSFDHKLDELKNRRFRKEEEIKTKEHDREGIHIGDMQEKMRSEMEEILKVKIEYSSS